MLCLVGSKGNMGKRYSCILRHLGIKFVGVDIEDSIPLQMDKYIVATPTSTHYDILMQLPKEARILCEKPISKNLVEVAKCIDKFGSNLHMVNNWRYAVNKPFVKSIVYNCYATGNDGFWWDLIQPLYISKILTASNTSPVFSCHADNVCISRECFDVSYIKMIEDFLSVGNVFNFGLVEILNAHEKAEEYTKWYGV